MADERRGWRIEGGQGIQIGTDNTQVNNFGASQSATSGRDVYMAGRNMYVGGREAGGSEPPSGSTTSVSTLTGEQVERLCNVLVAVFDEDTLEFFLRVRLDKNLAHYAPSGREFRFRVFKLVQRAEQEGWVPALISKAARYRPESTELRDLAYETGTSGIDVDRAGLERIVIPASGFQDVDIWHRRLGEVMERVCRVEVPVPGGSVLGTGFLVAPDLVLTNHHVIAPPGGQAGDLPGASVLFGHKLAADGTVVDPGKEYRLAAEAVVAARPPSIVDGLRNPGNRLPAADELDFALLRLAAPAGRAMLPGSSQARGWARLAAADSAPLQPGNPLLVLQHPDGKPLKLAIGQSLGLNGNGTRLRHTVSTLGGSSGSPCLTADLEVAAIHHSGDPNFDRDAEYNAAVPVAAILRFLAGSAVARELSADPD